MKIRVNSAFDVLATGERRVAEFSDCDTYRYSLDITWDTTTPALHVIGLNPSTADEMKDDSTVRFLKAWAGRHNFGALWMTNLFAFRATDPEDMIIVSDPVGGEANDLAIFNRSRRAGKVIAAWGAHGGILNRQNEVLDYLNETWCFKTTKDGHPHHPLYLPSGISISKYRDGGGKNLVANSSGGVRAAADGINGTTEGRDS